MTAEPRPPVSTTIEDVATLAGVSLGTVSNVVNAPAKVSASTRARVEVAIAKLGWTPNESARRLRAGAAAPGARGADLSARPGSGLPSEPARPGPIGSGGLASGSAEMTASDSRTRTETTSMTTSTTTTSARTGPTLSEAVTDQLARQVIELPSWAFGNSGTRFKVFTTAGTPRTIQEKIADAAQVNAVTGLAPKVALHIPWDKVDDYTGLRRYAEDLGVGLGTVNSNTFQDDAYKFGSLTHVDAAVRQRAVDHHLDCIDVMDQTGSTDLKIWLADGTNYAGQGDLRGRQDRLADSLQQIYDRIGADQRLVLEYKFFEPAFYHMDVPDWGTAYTQVVALGERATVCLDTGHHAPGTNIEFIVAQLLRLGKLGSFDFNSRYYADDDLIVGSADPFQLFRILYEVVRGGGLDPAAGVAFMLDQCHNIEAKIPGQIRSVLNVQEMTARALLVDTSALLAAQEHGDVLGANAVLMDAFFTDVRPALAAWRESRELPADPMAAFAASGYQQQIEASRVGGTQAGWGA